MSGKKRGNYSCGRCGQPKKGHICNAETTTFTADSSSTVSTPASSLSIHTPQREPHSHPRRALVFDEEPQSHPRRALVFNENEVNLSPLSDDEGLSDGSPETSVETGDVRLPWNCIWEVLRRLPPTSLLSAANVCRGWRDCSRKIWRAAEELKLNIPSKVPVGMVRSLLQKCSGLVSLSLMIESDVDVTMLSCIAFSCPNIGSLAIRLSDSAANRISGDELGRFVADRRCLSSLKMEGCLNFGGLSLCSSTLSTLWLSDLFSLSKMVFHSPNLKELSLDFSHQGNDCTDLVTMADSLGRTCPGLKNVHIASLQLSHTVVLALAAANLRNLRMLSLVLGSEITDASVAAITSSYENLELLDLSRFSQTTKDSSQVKPSNLDGLKSKNIDRKSTSFNGVQASVHDQWSLKTPEKPLQIPRRTRNRGSVASSVKQGKEFAKGLQTPLEEGYSDRQDQIRLNARVSSDKRLKLSESTSGLAGGSSKSGVSTKLPSKYKLLCEFFDCMESSIQLLRSKGSMSTFTNICSKIESLTDRRFSFAHLAQIKYLLPEAVSIEKVLLQDEQSFCEKPELQVTLQFNAFKNDKKQKEGTEYLSLRKVFRERIFSFSHAHPEGDEVPEDHSSSGIAGIQGTPAKPISTPSRPVSVTPELQTPKRCSMSPDDNFNTPCKSIKRLLPRSLKFDELDVREQAMVESDIGFLPESLLESIREKQMKAMEELDTGVSQVEWRQQMIACLPKLFDMILLIFQSINRSVMTKEKLMDKIIRSHCGINHIIDRREVEEQLKLLGEFIPDWISCKVAASGECLICVDKNSSPELIRSRFTDMVKNSRETQVLTG